MSHVFLVHSRLAPAHARLAWGAGTEPDVGSALGILTMQCVRSLTDERRSDAPPRPHHPIPSEGQIDTKAACPVSGELPLRIKAKTSSRIGVFREFSTPSAMRRN